MPTSTQVAALARELEPPSRKTEVHVEWGVIVEETELDDADLLVVFPRTRKAARRAAQGYHNRTVVQRTVTVTTIATPWEKS